jgi:N-ethylmaleimide reductase
MNLLQPLTAGKLELANRLVMAPMTRSRANTEGVPSPLAIDYYRQRATAGLIITEATQVSPLGQGYARTPGMHTQPQAEAWQQITAAVHQQNGKIAQQLFHVGRISHAANRTTPQQPVAPSAIRAAGSVWTDTQGMQPFDEPRALETHEIKAIIDDFAASTRMALTANFDAIELHAASGYLHQQFLTPNTNHRTDQYGGSIPNRIRFVVETLEAMTHEAPHRIGVKLSPKMQFNDCYDPNPEDTYIELVKAIANLPLAYIHLMRVPDLDMSPILKPLSNKPFFLGGGFDPTSAEATINANHADAIVIGKWFISNPDLIHRAGNHLPLATPDTNTFYTPGPQGYTDYPTL